MSFLIANANELVDYLKDFTGSSNDTEIKQCIFLAEMAMRNIELPALRTNPLETLGVADANGQIPIPADMNKPILFYNQGNDGQQSSSGPWIIYDRIGDRDMLGAQMVAPYYLNPVNVPTVIRGKFSEVGQKYTFLPLLSQGAVINLYYYKAWPLLFTPTTDVISTTGTVGSITGSDPWTATITGMTTTVGLTVGDVLTATAGTGSFGTGGEVTVASIVSSTSITITKAGGTIPTAGTVTLITLNANVQNNAVLDTWPEGYVYATLSEYYIKRHNPQDAAIFKTKYDEAWKTVENQNNLGKWSGGHTRLTSIFQPRRWFQYAVK